MKGISVQLSSISSHLEGQLKAGEPTWDSYLLITEKTTCELLTLARIAFTDLEQHLPRDLALFFDHAATLLKQYFKNRPKGEVEDEKEDEDVVKRFLDNKNTLDIKPEIDSNDDARGELFKFLAQNEQKQKNTQIMLESMPRYSTDYAYHPQINRKASKFERDSLLPEIGRGSVLRNMVNSNNPLKQGKLSHHEAKQIDLKEQEAQTDLSFEALTDFLTSSPNACTVIAQEKCETTTQMANFQLQKANNGEVTEKKNGENNVDGPFEHKNEHSARERKEKRHKKDETNQREIGAAEYLNTESKTEVVSEVISSKKLQAKQEAKHSNSKHRKNPDKRESSNSMFSSKKDIVKGVKKPAGRPSKENRDNKEGARPNHESKFSQQRNNHSSSYVTTILETNQELSASNSYEATPEQRQYKNAEDPAIKIEDDDGIERQLNPAQELQTKRGESLEKGLVDQASQQENEQKQEQQENHKKLSVGRKMSRLSRDKVASNKQEPSRVELAIEQAYACTAGHPFYRKPSRDDRPDASLPKIEERGRPRQEAESLRRQIYESSPYARVLQGDQRGLKGSNSQQLLHRSLHVGHSDPRVREGMLRDEEARVMREVEERGGRKTQLPQLVRTIRRYELLHASVCGENCVHLGKFYEFLRRRNLTGCLPRRELLPHKKNIEITTMQ